MLKQSLLVVARFVHCRCASKFCFHRVDNFWPWVNNKAEPTTTYYGTQHFRSDSHIAAPRDGVPINSDDAATDTINDDELSAIPNTPGKYIALLFTKNHQCCKSFPVTNTVCSCGFLLFSLVFFFSLHLTITLATRRYGMHESYDQYQLCQRTERNRGLYTADQRVNRNDQRGTRQNPNGNRRGLECPEERDYYPWWHPSPWIGTDVVLLIELC